jgi:PAS domain S-box-containing protein
MNAARGSPEDELEHYRILSEMTSDYAFKFRIEPDGLPALEWISESFARDFGFVPDVPTDLFERVHPDDRRLVAGALEELYSGREAEAEVRLLPSSGGELWIHFRVKPVLEAGRVVGTYGALQDIHDRKMAEELWRQAEARFRAQYNSSPIPTGIWQRVGDDFILIDFNRAAEELTQGGIARLLGRTARQFFGDEARVIADMQRCFDTGVTVRRELPGYRFRSTGEVKDLYVTWARVQPALLMVHILDVTEWRRAEAERNELQAKLEPPGGS